VTLWEVPANRWWPAALVLYALGGLSLTVLLVVMTRLNPWSLLALLFVPYGLASVGPARARVRLTPDAVEVRGLRTTRLRYADIASVEVAPEWDGAPSLWVRLDTSWPQAAPEVLRPPPEWWHEGGHSLPEAVALIRSRVDAAHSGQPGRDPGGPLVLPQD
jgi:hypothetical protein